MDWMKSMGSMLDGFDGLKPDVQQKVRDNIREFSKPGGQLEKAMGAMEAFEDFPWEEEAPKTDAPSPTASPKETKSAQATKTQDTRSAQATQSASAQSSKGVTSTSTKASSTSASSSSSSPAPTEKALNYTIITQYDTPLDSFEKLVQELDGGAGKKDVRPHRQFYETNMTASQAVQIKAKYAFLESVYTIPEGYYDSGSDDKELFRAVSRIRDTWNLPGDEIHTLRPERKQSEYTSYDIIRRAPISGGQNAPYWKKMISSPFRNPPQPPSQDPPYAADDSGGLGTTIYILDDGFDLSSPVGGFWICFSKC
jgi:hypothetical protein